MFLSQQNLKLFYKFYFRLEAYDRNLNFKNPDETLADQSKEFAMELPDASTYRDLNSDSSFGSFTEEDLSQYLLQFQKSLTKDAKDLYHERFLRYVRMASKDDKIYIQAECRAQMKKTVVYKLDLSLNIQGQVYQAQCECGAGMGPDAHCKHVCALLYGLCKFGMTGEIKTELACTERLQTFHQCKKFKGSPKKCEDLQLSVNDSRSGSPLYDPRPRQATDFDYHYFQNVCNGSPFRTLPTVQRHQPANMHGVAHDHDYLLLTPEEHYLKGQNMTEISREGIETFEKATVEQSASKLWMHARTKRLHSSNFGRICKATERTDMVKLASSLTASANVKTAAITHGRKYERVALKAFEAKKGLKVEKCGTFISEFVPYLASTPDGIVKDSALVEVKCPYAARDRPINASTVPYLKLEDGQLQLDRRHDYYYQVQGQMFCTGFELCHFCVYTLKDFLTFEVTKDDAFINDMVKKLSEFYKLYFEKAVLQRHFYLDYYNYGF